MSSTSSKIIRFPSGAVLASAIIGIRVSGAYRSPDGHDFKPRVNVDYSGGGAEPQVKSLVVEFDTVEARDIAAENYLKLWEAAING